MSLNTRIRGAQIVLTEEVFAVADKLAFIDADGVMKQDAWADIATAVAGDGIQNIANQFAVDVSDFAGEGLEDDASENLRVKLDGSTIARSASGIKVADDSLDDTQLNAGVGTPGQYLELTTGGGIQWSNPAGTDTFIGLTDTPGAYDGAGRGVRINGANNALEFYDVVDTDEKVKATGETGDVAGYLDDVVTNLNTGAVDVSADSIMILDADDSIAKLESIADLATAIAGDGLGATAGVLAVNVDDVTLQITGDTLSVKKDYLVEADVVKEDLSSQIDDTGYAGDFTLSNTPASGTLMVFLNGLVQQEGTGKDYTLSGTTVSFATAPITADIVLVYYVKD